MTPQDLASLVQAVSGTYNLPDDLLAAQIQVESSGDPFAFRYEHEFFENYILNKPAKAAKYGPLAACSYGLLQVMFEVAVEMDFTGRPEDLFEPRVGLAFGAKKMRALWDWAGGRSTDYVRALAAYNGGTGGNVAMPYRNLHYAEQVYVAAGRPWVI